MDISKLYLFLILVGGLGAFSDPGASFVLSTGNATSPKEHELLAKIAEETTITNTTPETDIIPTTPQTTHTPKTEFSRISVILICMGVIFIWVYFHVCFHILCGWEQSDAVPMNDSRDTPDVSISFIDSDQVNQVEDVITTQPSALETAF